MRRLLIGGLPVSVLFACVVLSLATAAPRGEHVRTFGFGMVESWERLVGLATDSQGRIITAYGNFSVSRYTPEGRPDPTFAGDGSRDVAFSRFAARQAGAVAVDRRGRITLGGFVYDNDCSRGVHEDCPAYPAFARFLPNGNLDRAFGTRGQLILRQLGEISALRTLPGGGLLAGGSFVNRMLLFKVNEDGALNRRFGRNGAAILPPLKESSAGRGSVGEIARDSRGRIVVSNSSDLGEMAPAKAVRFTPAGRLDTSFGGGDGFATLPGGAFNNAAMSGGSLAINRDDSIYLSGLVVWPFRGVAVARFTHAGGLDPGYGENGVATGPEEFPARFNVDLSLQPDEAVVVAGASGGMALARFTPAGEFDRSFGENGISPRVDSWGYHGHLLRLRDGRLLAGDARRSLAGAIVGRFLPDGNLDTSLRGTGVVEIPTRASGADLAYAVARDRGGRIYLAGEGSRGFAILRLRRNGAVDRSFAEQGRFTFAEKADQVRALVPLRSGGLIAVGTGRALGRNPGPSSAFVVTRLTSHGRLDRAFGEAGVARVLFRNYSATPRTAAVDARGRILIGGTAGAGATLVRLRPGGLSDPGFGSDGEVTLKEFDYVGEVKPLRDGGLMVVGAKQRTCSSDGCTWDLVVARLREGGAYDRSFSADGLARVRRGYGVGVIVSKHGVTVAGTRNECRAQDGGNEYSHPCNGLLAARFTAAGARDRSFGGDGIVRLDAPGRIRDMAALGGGRVLLAGTEGRRFAVQILTSRGTRPRGGDRGRRDVLVGLRRSEAYGVVAHPRLGALVAGWTTRNLGGKEFALARFRGIR